MRAPGELGCTVLVNFQRHHMHSTRRSVHACSDEVRCATAGAAAEFQAVLETRPADAAAANNLAVCRLYLCDLPGAVMGIEAAVKADPGSHLREVVLTNLCVLIRLDAGVSLAATFLLFQWLVMLGQISAGHASTPVLCDCRDDVRSLSSLCCFAWKLRVALCM